MKKVFSCGHHGNGRFCHRCTQERAKQQAQSDRRAARHALAERLNVRPGQFPNEILQRAEGVLSQARRDGARALRACGARKLNGTAALVSVRIGRGHRMLFRTGGGAPQFLELLTHERYNTRIGQYH